MKKAVMTRAWEIYRTLTGDRNAKLSMALSQAWNEVKFPVVKKTIQEIVNEVLYEGYAKVWEKGEMKRLYVTKIKGRTSKSTTTEGIGYIDLVSKAYVASRPANVTDMRLITELYFAA